MPTSDEHWQIEGYLLGHPEAVYIALGEPDNVKTVQQEVCTKVLLGILAYKKSEDLLRSAASP